MRHLIPLLVLLGWTLASGCSSSTSPRAREARETSPGPVATAPGDSPRDAGPSGAPTPGPAPAPSPTARPSPEPQRPAPTVQAPAGPTGPGPSAPTSPTAPSVPQAPTPVPSGGAIETVRGIHDPAIIREGDWFYCFSTGYGLPIHRSRDLVTWESVGRVFVNDVPPWAKEQIPTSVNVWAPDIAFVDGRYVLTYTVATFGQNRSLIGMASSPTLDPSARGYRWRNDGKVVESFIGDDFNAIDSNLLIRGDRAYLYFGSYWTGVKMVELDRRTLKPREGARRVSVARREADGGIEAPFVVFRDGWYYMFLSFDKCCAGVNSTYNVRVGRSRSPEGPFYDRQNTPMMRGGGTRVLQTDGRMIGPGHCCVFEDGGRWYIGYHFYDRDAAGVQTMQVRELLWDHLGWPRAGAAIGGF